MTPLIFNLPLLCYLQFSRMNSDFKGKHGIPCLKSFLKKISNYIIATFPDKTVNVSLQFCSLIYMQSIATK